jgi:hypothetical protein
VNRQQLAKVLRSACAIAEDADVLVLGSQSILGSFDEDDLPVEATASIEADIAFLDDPTRSKSDEVEGVIGEMSDFHDMNGFYAEGVHVDTAILPEGWRDRLVEWEVRSAYPAKPRFLDPHDLAVSKLAAGREKDKAFVDALLRYRLLDVQVLRERNEMLGDAHEARRVRTRGFLDFYDGGQGREPLR